MPRAATGSVRFRNGVWYARVTLGPGNRPTFALPTCETEEAASERLALLSGLARQLRDAGHAELAPGFLERAAAREGKALEAVQAAVAKLCSGRVAVPKRDARVTTFRAFGERWTSGELHRRWPDHVKAKKTAKSDAGRLELYVYPIVGDVPLAEFTLDHAEAVMASLPAEMSPATRRHTAIVIHKVLAMAVFPARIIEANPLPKGFLPGIGAGKALSYLYPDEDRNLLGCTDVPLGHRVLYGFLAREGMRKGEAAGLT